MICLTLLILFSLIGSILAITKGPKIVFLILNILLLVYSLGMLVFVGLLLILHLWLIGTNTTTYEVLK